MSSSAHDNSVSTRLHDGDAAAFDEVVQAHRGAVYGYLRARVTSSADALRLAEATFDRFFICRADCRADESIRETLLVIAQTQLSEDVASQSRQVEASWTSLCLNVDQSPDATADDDRSADALNARLRERLLTLEPAEREVIESVYRGDRSLSEVGRRLRRSESAVRRLLMRARRSLREGLRP